MAAGVLVIAVLGGGIVVLGGLASSDASPTPIPQTDSPTLAPTIAPTLSPEASAPDAPTDAPAPTLEPTAEPTAQPTVSISSQLTLTGAKASSVVGNREKFNADKVIDGRLDTSWQEGAVQEAGQWIEVTFDPAQVDFLVIHSGYQLSRDAYLANRRPREVLVSVNGGAPVPFVLADTEDPQRISLDGGGGDATRVRIEIVTTYDPEKTDYPGSPFDDMAISEIAVFGFLAG